MVVLGVAGVVRPPLLVDGAAHWAGDGAGDFADKLLEGGHGGGGEVRARDGDVDVEVGDGLLQCLRVLLHPLG